MADPQADATMRIADRIKLQFLHQIVTLIGVPALCAVSWWGFSEMVALREDMAAVKTLVTRVDRLERQADGRPAAYPMADGRELERDVHRLDGRVTVLERARD